MNLTIEKMIYGGDGLARLGDGKAVFVPFVLPGEEINAAIVKEKSSFARANAQEVTRKSEKRVQPLCPYFGDCGGCHYQHTDYNTQLEWKRAILRETLQRNAKLEWPGEIITHAGEPWHYRNRTRLKVRGGSDFALGYHRFASHDLLTIKECPISSPAVNRVIQQLWEIGLAGGVPAGVSEIEFFVDHADSRLVLEIFQAPGARGMREFAGELQNRISNIQGVGIFTEQPGTAAPARLTDSIGNPSLLYQVGEKAFRVSAGSFFQTNRFLLNELVKTVVSDFYGNIALDLYSGVGLFANHLAKRFTQVFAVESAPSSAEDLQSNVLKNVVPVKTATEQFLPRCLNMHPDVVVVDPPRAGLGPKATQLLAALRVKRISYVSCDPATLARDVRLLLETGYHVEEIHMMDLFPQTFHIESVVRLAR
ncbi:MAG TPA: class I SAM-dependent RNA methyltransferase [Candidatus Limnocylindrales bacterium]|nr:class I SAM-dependent RNA methyltransferase [Candidatus Limnocylindrales bacterium]